MLVIVEKNKQDRHDCENLSIFAVALYLTLKVTGLHLNQSDPISLTRRISDNFKKGWQEVKQCMKLNNLF